MIIRFEEKVSIENAQRVCQWSNSLGKVFQEQWMGPRIPFPLTLQVLQELEGIFAIFEGQEFVGVIQKIRQEDSNLHIGRFFSNYFSIIFVQTLFPIMNKITPISF